MRPGQALARPRDRDRAHRAAAPAGSARGARQAGSSSLKSWTWLAAEGPARERGLSQKRKSAHNVFLVRDCKPGPRVLLLVPHYNIKMQFDSGQARPCRWLGRIPTDAGGQGGVAWVLRCGAGVHSGWRGGSLHDLGSLRWPDPKTRAAGRRRQGDASPAPASSRAAQDCFPRPYLSLKLIFSFNVVIGTKDTGKSFVKANAATNRGTSQHL